MYRDVAQWLDIRHRILMQGVSIRRIAFETKIDRKTVYRIRDQPLPLPYKPRSQRCPKLGPHTASVRRTLKDNATLPLSARLSIRAIYGHIRGEEGLRGGHSTVKDYARPIATDGDRVWEYAYDLLTSLEKARAIDFLFLLSRADPPVILAARAEQLLREASRAVSVTEKPASWAEAKQGAFESMRAVLQKDISLDTLRRDVGGLPALGVLLHRLYEGVCPTAIGL
jgi:hypothetical protein